MGLPIPAYRFLMRLPTSSARWSAWRTRLSESGGWVVLIQKVTVRVAGVDRIFVLVPSASAFIRSGGTLVMMSASPFSSATMRGKSSGIGFQTTRSIAGGLPSQPHQSRLASITSRSSFTHSTKRYAPVPTGRRASSFTPSSVVRRAGRICAPICARRTSSSGSGFFVTIRMVVGFATWTDSIVAKPACTTVLPGTRLRSSVALTSSAANGTPSWNFTPWRSVNSHVVSFTFFQATASPGSSRSEPSHRVSVS